MGKGLFETAVVLSQHGEDDYSLWVAELPVGAVREARQSEAVAQGGLEAIMDAIHVGDSEGKLNFLYHGGDGFSLRTMDAGEGFLEGHETNGCSVRGNREEIQAEIMYAFAQ